MKRRLFKDRVETSTDKSLGEDTSKQGWNNDKTEELNLTDGADTEVIVEDKIDADHELAVRLTHEEQEKYTIEEGARLLAEFFERRKKQLATERLYKREKKWIDEFKPIDDDSQQQEESTKKTPRADSEEESSKKQKLEEDNHMKKREADGSSKNYKIFSEMLDDFDRQDVIDLHRLVNERYETTSPEGYDLLLWGDLKTLFEPNEEDEI
ncbi:hypothetical protein Tco_1167873 [Tanacetum coccineum]